MMSSFDLNWFRNPFGISGFLSYPIAAVGLLVVAIGFVVVDGPDEPSTVGAATPAGLIFTTPAGETLVVGPPGLAVDHVGLDGDAITVSLVTGPTHGTLSLSPTGEFVYTPSEGFTGIDSFDYEVSDGKSSIQATAFIEVSGEGVTNQQDQSGQAGQGETPADELALDESTDDGTTEQSGASGSGVYASYCAGCHGGSGQGGAGPVLAGQSLSVAAIRSATANGVGSMPGFSGSLS
ncbi:MAG: hypothetical protein GY724_16760, partial [Actinomycetia bacterium]|nr:hypothetical protein [Actinomycetes bacterium]